MSSRDTASPTQSIVVEYDLPESPEKVWRALTEPRLLAAWLMPTDIRPEVGHRFTFQTQPVADWDGVVHCEVLVVEPPTRLRYSWRGGSAQRQGYGHEIDTVVTWTLARRPDGGTLLRLDHDGFAQGAYAFERMNQGWRGKVAERMSQVLAQAAA
jgi:uncharacterized protein YndB with AHSA1/START domain